jgi:hypothetical protein
MARLPKTLDCFHLTPAAIAQIIRDAHAERVRLSVFAPKPASGLVFYIWFVSLLRAHLIGLNRGWEENTIDGLEVVENVELQIRIAYVLAETIDDALITSYRGPVSRTLASRNGQLPLLPQEFREPQPREASGEVRPIVPFETWFVAVRPMTGAYRLELALPTDHEGGRFTEWAQRIPLGEVSLDSEPKLDAIDEKAKVVTPKPVPKRKKPRPAPEAKPANDTGTDDDSKK